MKPDVPSPGGGGHRGRPNQPALDGLRGLGLVLVLWYHAAPDQVPGGLLALSLFFTLSGFLICRLVLDEIDRTGTIGVLAFWTRRFRRLMPASVLTLLGVMAVTLYSPLVWGRSLSTVASDVLSAFAQVSNWWFFVSGQGYSALFSPTSPVVHYWSLSVEEQFYFLFPALVFISHRFAASRRVFVGLLLFSAFASWTIMATFPVGDHLYYGSDARFGEIAVGCLLAVLVRGAFWEERGERIERAFAPWGWLGLLAILVMSLLCREHERTPWLYPWGFMATSMLTSFIIVAVTREGLTQRILAARIPVALGKISYGVYLVHWPVFRALTPARLGLGEAATLAVELAVVTVLGTLSYFIVEQPIRTGRAVRRTSLIVAAWAVAGSILVGWTAYEMQRVGAPAVWTTLTPEEIRARLSEPTDAEVGEGRAVAELPLPVGPALEDPDATEVVLLRGDSIPDYLASAVAAWGRTRGITVRNGSKFSCSVASNVSASGHTCPARADDEAWANGGGIDAVLWYPGVNDVFFDIDGVPGTSAEGRARVIARLREHAEIYTARGIPVVINQITMPAPVDPKSVYHDRESIRALSRALEALDAVPGVVVDDALYRFMERRPRDRLLRPDGVHTPDPKVGFAVFDMGVGDELLAAVEEAAGELGAP
jgi:peptidoglycan/LPS O-acetylase OafA/YrhL